MTLIFILLFAFFINDVQNLQFFFLLQKCACNTCAHACKHTHMLTVWSLATAFIAFIACHSVLTADWHTQTHSFSLCVYMCVSVCLSLPPPLLSQTCSFCFSASLSLQRKPWPRFQTRLVAMAKIFSEYYGLSLNYTCCVRSTCACMCFPLRRAFHSSKLSWEWSSLSAIRESKLKPQMLLLIWAHTFHWK